MIEKVTFDFQKLAIIKSRISRQKKILSTEAVNSRKFNLITESIKRSELLKHRLIIDFLKAIAVVARANNVPLSLPAIIANGIVDNDQLVYKLIREYWSSYELQYYKLYKHNRYRQRL